ncbi:MAG: hypothetical protein OXH75_17660 [Acidobacteria bacterium]|nr:hypothetical protein [Acidobacteriota bacterium]
MRASQYDLVSVRQARSRSAAIVRTNIAGIRWQFIRADEKPATPPNDGNYPSLGGWVKTQLRGDDVWVTAQTWKQLLGRWLPWSEPVQSSSVGGDLVLESAHPVGADGPDIEIPDLDLDIDIDDKELPPVPDPRDPYDPNWEGRERLIGDSTDPRYPFDSTVLSTDLVRDVFQELDFAWNGAVLNIDGVRRFAPGEDRPAHPTLMFTPDTAELVQSAISPPLSQRANRIKARLVRSRTQAWEPETVAIDDADLQADDGMVLELDLGDSPGTISPTTLKRLGYQWLRGNRELGRFRVRTLPGARAEWLDVRKGDVVMAYYADDLGHTVPVRWLITDDRFLADWTLEFDCQEQPAGVFGDGLDLPHLVPDISIPGQFPGDLTGLSAVPEGYRGRDGSRRARLLASWDASPAPRSRIRWRLFVPAGESLEYDTFDDDGNPVKVTRTGPWEDAWAYVVSEGDSVVIPDVRPGARYELSGQNVTAADVEGRWSASVTVLVPENVGKPAALAGAKLEARQGGYVASWDDPPPDTARIALYDAVASGSRPKAPFARVGRGTTSFTRSGLPAEARDVWLVPEDTEGVEGPATKLTVTPNAPPADGQDGLSFEYVFAAYAGSSVPADLRPDDDWGYDRPGTRTSGQNSLTWTDGAPSLTASAPNLFRSERRIAGQPAAGDAVADDWSEPVIVGRFGEEGVPGADGEDGRGYEYIFAIHSGQTVAVNQLPENDWGFDEPEIRNGVEWTDGAENDVTAAKPFLLRCERQIEGTPVKGAAVSDDWSAPTVVGRYGEQGVPGADGEDGLGYEWIFARTATATLKDAQKPDNAWGFDMPGTAGTGADALVWTDGAPSLQAAFPVLWRASRRVEGTPATGAAIADAWSEPTVVGRFVAGADGEDGQGFEYIFAAHTGISVAANQLPLNSWGFDEPGTRNGVTWSDGAPTLTEAAPFLLRCEREISGTPSTGDAVADDWDTPVVVGHFGKDGIPGADGEDAHGREYIFCVHSGDSLPTNQRPLDTWGFDEPGTRNRKTWHDGAPSVTLANPVLFRCERDITGSPAKGDAVSDAWDEPTIVGRYGPKGDKGDQGVPGARGDDGAPGADGVGREYVFATSAAASIPNNQLPSNAWGFESPGTVGGLTWHDGSPGITEAAPNLFRAGRRIVGDPAAGDAISDNWDTPTIVGRYGKDGVPGAKGEDGEAAQGREYVFARVASTVASNQVPEDDWAFDEPETRNGLAWTDGAPNLTPALPVLVRCERRVPGTPNKGDTPPPTLPANGWTGWGAPVIVGRYGKDAQSIPPPRIAGLRAWSDRSGPDEIRRLVVMLDEVPGASGYRLLVTLDDGETNLRQLSVDLPTSAAGKWTRVLSTTSKFVIAFTVRAHSITSEGGVSGPSPIFRAVLEYLPPPATPILPQMPRPAIRRWKATVRITWSEIPFASTYIVQRRESGGQWATWRRWPGLTIIDIRPPGTWEYRVAYVVESVASPYSDVASITIPSESGAGDPEPTPPIARRVRPTGYSHLLRRLGRAVNSNSLRGGQWTLSGARGTWDGNRVLTLTTTDDQDASLSRMAVGSTITLYRDGGDQWADYTVRATPTFRATSGLSNLQNAQIQIAYLRSYGAQPSSGHLTLYFNSAAQTTLRASDAVPAPVGNELIAEITGPTLSASGTQITLRSVLSGSLAGGSVSRNWYSQESGGSSIGTGQELQVSPTATTVYRFEAEVSAVTAVARTTVVVAEAPQAAGAISGSAQIVGTGIQLVVSWDGAGGGGQPTSWLVEYNVGDGWVGRRIAGENFDFLTTIDGVGANFQDIELRVPNIEEPSLGIGWSGNWDLATSLIDAGVATAELRSLVFGNSSNTGLAQNTIQMRITSATAPDVSTAGPDLTAAVEQFARAFRLSRDSDSQTRVWRGPNAAGNRLTDAAEPYRWQPPTDPESPAGTAAYIRAARRANYTLRIADGDPPSSVQVRVTPSNMVGSGSPLTSVIPVRGAGPPSPLTITAMTVRGVIASYDEGNSYWAWLARIHYTGGEGSSGFDLEWWLPNYQSWGSGGGVTPVGIGQLASANTDIGGPTVRYAGPDTPSSELYQEVTIRLRAKNQYGASEWSSMTRQVQY